MTFAWKPDSHWDNHEDYPTEDWQDDVLEGGTRQSYIDWVNSRIEEDAEPVEPPVKLERTLRGFLHVTIS